MTKPLFTIRDAWPWAALTAVALLVCVLAAVYGQGSTIAYVVALASASATLGLVGLHFWRRWKEVDAWNRAPKLWGEVAVLSKVASTVNWMYLRDAPLKAIDFAARLRQPRQTIDMISDAIAGCDVTYHPAPWMVNGVLVGGTQEGEHITVVGPEVAGIERTRALIIHELSHRALTALGIPAGVNGENHHRIFSEEGLGA